MAMGSDAKASVKLGFWIGVGLLILTVLLAVVQVLIGKATGR